MSKVEIMGKLFPKCPICGSDQKYELSSFYPNIRCKSCKSEWIVYDYGMALKFTPQKGWHTKLLDKIYSFEFWKDLDKFSTSEPQIMHRIIAPVDCVGREPDHIKPSKGYLIFELENKFVYESTDNQMNKVRVEIPIDGIRETMITTEGVSEKLATILTFAFGVLGAIPGLISPEKKFLLVTYEDSQGLPHTVVFDLHNDEKSMKELINLLSYLKEKYTKNASTEK